MSCLSLLPSELCAAPFVTAPALAVMIIGLIIAAFARGYSGFGFSALLVASWSLVAPPSVPVAVAVLLEISASLLQAVGVWGHVDWRRVGLLLAGAVFGTPFGVAVLTIASPDLLRVLIAILLLVCCFALLRGFTLKREAGVAGEVAVGGVSGFVNGATAMGGLPVALFLAAIALKPATMRASFIAYFFALDILAGSLLVREGVLGMPAVTMAALSLPLLVAGLWLGGRHFLAASPEQFRRHTLFLLMGLAVLGLVRALL